MRFIIRLILISLLIFFCAHPVMADMVFPARLELVEIQPGVFDVQFNLPVRNQTRIKANPVLPDICIVTEPDNQALTIETRRSVPENSGGSRPPCPRLPLQGFRQAAVRRVWYRGLLAVLAVLACYGPPF